MPLVSSPLDLLVMLAAVALPVLVVVLVLRLFLSTLASNARDGEDATRQRQD